MSELPSKGFELKRFLGRFTLKPKIWTPEKVKREGFVQSLEILSEAVYAAVGPDDSAFQERLNFLGGITQDTKDQKIIFETSENKIVVFKGENNPRKIFTIGLGEGDNIYFIAKNPRQDGEEIHKFAPYASITTEDELKTTVRNFILLEPKANELIKTSSEAIKGKMAEFKKEAEAEADKVVLNTTRAQGRS